MSDGRKKKPVVPNLRFPEFRDAGEWKKKRLQELMISISNGLTIAQAACLNGFKVTRIETISEGNIDLSKIGYIETDQDISSYKLNQGDILFSHINSLSHIGKNAYVERDYALYHGMNLLRFQVDKTKNSPKFVYYLINTENFKSSVRERSNQAVNQASINQTEIGKSRTLVPVKNEQQKIADCLSSLDELIELEALQCEVLKQHKKSLMQQLFPAEGETVPRLRFPEFRDAGAWEVKRLGDVGENLDSRRIPITKKDRIKGEIPYYGASGIIDYVKNYIFDDDLLCISEDGANLVARTYPIAFSISGKTWVNNHAHVLKFKKKFTQVLVENHLNSINIEDYLTGMAQPKLNRAKLDIIPIPLPKPVEQQKIADCLSSLDELIELQSQKVEALKAHKKGMMQQLFPQEVA